MCSGHGEVLLRKEAWSGFCCLTWSESGMLGCSSPSVVSRWESGCNGSLPWSRKGFLFQKSFELCWCLYPCVLIALVFLPPCTNLDIWAEVSGNVIRCSSLLVYHGHFEIFHILLGVFYYFRYFLLLQATQKWFTVLQTWRQLWSLVQGLSLMMCKKPLKKNRYLMLDGCLTV